ncbi:hypothetical protein ACIQFZ_21480 [Streptomyces sp. NPDC093064]|uniref:hypothetical protein n=1 Tax=unclassified Streptomyces TaxID=2593676 RepID=UPI00344AC873
MRTIGTRFGVLAGITTLTLGVLAGPVAHAATADTTAAACKSGHGVGELWSPKGRNIGVEKNWKCDGHGGYNGKFRWWKSEDGVWAQMLIKWESGRREQKKMKFGKLYTYKGAYGVYMRACDSSGCGGWW